MEQAIATVESSNPLDAPTAQFSQALARRGDNRTAMMKWIGANLVEGRDYHVINGRKSMGKAGAEKICGMLGLTVTFPTLKDYEQAAIDGRPIENIILRCHIVNAKGEIVADGVGARQVSKDKGDLNKALKMAAKSAMVDTVLRCGGLSEVFTQDIEDMPQGDVGGGHGGGQQHSGGSSQGTSSGGVRLATVKQIGLLRVKIKQAGDAGGCTESEVLKKFNLAKLEDMPIGAVNDALAYIANPA